MTYEDYIEKVIRSAGIPDDAQKGIYFGGWNLYRFDGQVKGFKNKEMSEAYAQPCPPAIAADAVVRDIDVGDQAVFWEAPKPKGDQS